MTEQERGENTVDGKIQAPEKSRWQQPHFKMLDLGLTANTYNIFTDYDTNHS